MENLDLEDIDLEEIARLIKEGFTSGILDSQDENDEWFRIEWQIKINKFNTK